MLIDIAGVHDRHVDSQSLRQRDSLALPQLNNDSDPDSKPDPEPKPHSHVPAERPAAA